MTRRFLDDIRANITALLVTAGETTAPDLAALMIDQVDSVVDDEAAIASTTPSLAVPTAIAWQPLTTGIYDISVGGDGDFLKVDATAGNITGSSVAGFTYELDGKISFQDLGSNVAINFSILVDGVQAGFIAALTGGGGTRPRTAAFTHIVLSAPADALFQIGIQTPDGVQAIDIGSVGLQATIKPTNNAD